MILATASLVSASSCYAKSDANSAILETTPFQRNVKRTFPILAASAVLAVSLPGCALLRGPQKDAKPVTTFDSSGATGGGKLSAPTDNLFAASGSGTGQGSISIDSVLKPSGAKPKPAVPTPNPNPSVVTPIQKPQIATDKLQELAKRGEPNAKVYCATCHFFPDPELLDRDTWINSVLPAMRAGGSRHVPPATGDSSSINVEKQADPLRAAQMKAPALADDIWQTILAYYAVNSPEKLERPKPPRAIDFDLRHFKVEMPANNLVKTPATNAIRIDEERGHILIGETDPHSFLVFDKNLTLVQEARLSSAPTWFEHFTEPGSTQRKLSITLSGQMDPNDLAIGTLIAIDEQPPGTGLIYDKPTTLVTRLRRPVHTRIADFNKDGILDPLVGQFGDTIGQLAYYRGDALGQFREEILVPRPGSISSYVLDYDEDGDLDVITLMTQAREGVYLLRNDGSGKFAEEPLILLPSVYGCSSFDLADVNGDDLLDVVLTCGDNADHSMIFKPYHGLYIHLNKGEDKFEQAYFYPMNGAFGAKARDFDQDGDVDIAALSYFADFSQRPFESFIYFENEGDAQLFDFHPFTTDQALTGRWLQMDAGDVDGDGDIDIVLGNFLRRLMGPGSLPDDLRAKWSQPGPHFLLLRNTVK